MDILEKLKNPFKPSEIHWRVGNKSKAKDKATALAYLNARDVMKRLDDVLGIDGWSDRYVTEPPRKVRKYDKKSNDYYYEEICGRVICTLKVKVPAANEEGYEWVSKSDGAGETNVEGEKGGISDAFKRAAVKFGIGRYLYYLDTFYYPIDKWGKFLETPPLPNWAQPKQENKQ